MCHAFLYISLLSLHDYNVKIPIFMFSGGHEHKITIFFSFSWTSLWSFRIHFLSEAFEAITVVVA